MDVPADLGIDPGIFITGAIAIATALYLAAVR
jgi:hypothetical protein